MKNIIFYRPNVRFRAHSKSPRLSNITKHIYKRQPGLFANNARSKYVAPS